MNGRDAEGYSVDYREKDKTKVQKKRKQKTKKDKDKMIVDENLKQKDLINI